MITRDLTTSTFHVEACLLFIQPAEAPALPGMLTAVWDVVRDLNAGSWWLQKNKPLSAEVAAGMSPAKLPDVVRKAAEEMARSEAAVLELAQVGLHADAAGMIFSWTRRNPHDAVWLHQSMDGVELKPDSALHDPESPH